MENAVIIKARLELRKFQFLHGSKLSPKERAHINQAWEDGLVKDPEGSQQKYVVEEAYELAREMA